MTDRPDANEWTEWVCPPVLAARVVAVKLRNGLINAGSPDAFVWTQDESDHDIVAFKIIEVDHD